MYQSQVSFTFSAESDFPAGVIPGGTEMCIIMSQVIYIVLRAVIFSSCVCAAFVPLSYPRSLEIAYE